MIVNAMSLSQLQMTRHILQELEVMGIKSLSDARRVVAAAESTSHELRIRLGRKRMNRHRPVVECPDCNKPTLVKIVDGVGIRACLSCRWSALVEG